MDILRRRFFMAVTRCTGEHAIKPRLADAWIEHLDLIDADSLPPRLQQEFRRLRAAMYKELPMPGEHTARASIRKMSQKQAAGYTQRITDLFRELMTEQFSEQISKAEQQVNPAAEATYSPPTETMLN